MADKSKIARWLLSKKTEFGLKITELHWPKGFGLAIHDFEVRLTHENSVYVGRGADNDEDIALEKACVEAIERAACYQQGISSVGVAGHTSQLQAIQNSKNEAIERFLFSYHLEELVPFKKVEYSVTHDNLHDYTPTVLMMRKYSGENCCIAITTLDKMSFLGLSCEDTLDAAIEKAVIESLRNLSAFKNDPMAFNMALASDLDLWCCDSNLIAKVLKLASADETELLRLKLEIDHRTLMFPKSSLLAECPIFLEQSFVREVM